MERCQPFHHSVPSVVVIFVEVANALVSPIVLLRSMDDIEVMEDVAPAAEVSQGVEAPEPLRILANPLFTISNAPSPTNSKS